MAERTLIVEGLLTYDQAGKLLGVTGRTVWTLVDRGDLPAVRFGRSVRINPADMRTFILGGQPHLAQTFVSIFPADA